MATTSVLRALLLLPVLAAAAPAQGDRWFTVSPTDNRLRRIDPFGATTLSSIPITVPAGTVVGGNGLAVHPTTNELWALLQLQGAGGSRTLARVNPQTGAATVVGATGMQFAGIAFDGSGRLFAISGDGAATPETLFTLDLTTAAPTSFLALGAGTGGEAICWHAPGSSLFHASGIGRPNVDEVFERIDVASRGVTGIPLQGGDWNEVLVLAHLAGDNLLAVDLDFELWSVTTTGRVHALGTLDHDAKGLANLRATGGAYFAGYGAGCRAADGVIPILGGSGTPAVSANVTFRVLGGPANAPGVLAIGLGTNTFALAPGCDLHVLPLSPVAAPIALDAAGTLAVPLVVPFTLQPFDAYLQAAMLSGGPVTVSNALRMRIQ